MARFSPAVRARVYARDGFRCRECWESRLEELTIDHIIPRCRGGSDRLRNLQTLCRTCNGRKAAQVAVGLTGAVRRGVRLSIAESLLAAPLAHAAECLPGRCVDECPVYWGIHGVPA